MRFLRNESDQPGTDKAGNHIHSSIKNIFLMMESIPSEGLLMAVSEIIFDGESIMISAILSIKTSKGKEKVKEGLHEIRIDLLNGLKVEQTYLDLSITYYG